MEKIPMHRQMTTLACLLALFGGVGAAAAADPFTLTSTSFHDGGPLLQKYAGKQEGSPNCVGENVSPQLSWSNAPASTKSFAIVVSDPDGRIGLGAVHWVAYGIAPTVTSFAEGEAARPGPNAKYVGGKSSGGISYFMGPCPPAGTSNHHYTFQVIANDLEPGALPAGLTRDELFAKLDGHAKADASMVGVFRHP
jgi:Raf kinase inhibitor-like YbhB/YbcL family protein